ncbi:7385_t:CDS:1, partial [Acaulospora colombiana]
LDDIKFNAVSPSRLPENDTEVHFNILDSLCPMLSNPCNPLEQSLIERILTSLKPALNQYHGYYDAREQTSNGHGKIEKIARCWGKSGRRRSINAASIEDSIKLFNDSFLIRQKVGEGGFGRVYRVLETNAGTDSHEDSREPLALKLQIPPSAWEFYIIRKLHEKVPPPLIDSIITAKSLYYYKDESYMLTEFCHHGSILDAVNKVKKLNTSMDEIL